MKKRFSILFTVIITAFFICGIRCIPVVGENAYAECVIDAESKRVLYEYHGDTRLPMASTTKILTAISVLDTNLPLDKRIKIPKSAVGIEGSTAYLKEGEEYSIGDLLYGLMLRSGNDCAVALALETDGSVEKFSTRMNQTAQRAGAVNSSFRTPHGLPKSGHYTTAKDLSFITAYALQNQTFKTIVSTKFYEPKGWANKNKLLRLYDGAIGVKTGYTKEAGRCLVSAATKNGLTLVCSVLNCADTYGRSIKLLDDFFSVYKKQTLLSEGEEFSYMTAEKNMRGISRDNFYYPLLEGEEEYIEKIITPYFSPNHQEIVGQIQIYLLKRLLFCGFLYKL